MLKNIIFCLLLLLGIWVTTHSFSLAIIYNFCIILILDHFYIFEGFQTCNFNIPDAIVSDSPLVISLGEKISGSCLSEVEEEEERELEQTLTVSSLNNSFIFGRPVPDLLKRLKIGDQIKITGTQVSNSSIFTITDVSLNYFKVQEPVMADFFQYKGTVIITFEIISYSPSSIIYNKDLMKKQVHFIDKNLNQNYSDLTKIKDLREQINNANKNIQDNQTLINNYQQEISKNESTMFSNDLTLENKPDLIALINRSVDNDSTPRGNYMHRFNKKYRKLMQNNTNLEESNANLKYSIENSKQNIKKNYQTKCKLRKEMDQLLLKIQKNNNKSLLTNDSLTTQNKNFRKFMKSCRVPPAPKGTIITSNKQKKTC